jgi:YjbE family integral membrane protein
MEDCARLRRLLAFGAETAGCGDASVIITLSELSALAQVVVVDLVLAGDNAIVVGLVAAGLPRHQRAKVIMTGIMAATVLRVGFAVVTTRLLQIIGLTLAGGLLLLWVTWKLWREIAAQKSHATALACGAAADCAAEKTPRKSMRQAVIQIVLADVSMSLDNVLAVAGISLEHPWVLFVGLALSVALMGAAAAMIAGLLKRFPWVSYVGLAIIFYVAVKMIYSGSVDVMQATGAA